MENNEEILKLSQACELLNCHPNTLRQWEKDGLVECIRFGKRGDRRFRKSEILKLLKK
ncbi:MAG TPA: helix-turn-helix domain-containing protein [bacterium]|nr:helix-turn-helix domain-containing protein [bacterium]